MSNSRTDVQEGGDSSAIEDISKLQQFALGVGPAVCQVCGCGLREGDGVTVYAFRAAGNPIFEIGYVMCGVDEHEHPSVFTRGVHEFVVTGRFGRCVDESVSWLVLGELVPVRVSVASSCVARAVGDVTRDTSVWCSDDARCWERSKSWLAAVPDHARIGGGGE